MDRKRIFKHSNEIALVFLFAAFLFAVKLIHIGMLPAYVDESGFILTSLDSDYERMLDSFGQGRWFLSYQFLPTLWMQRAGLVADLAGAGRVWNSLFGSLSFMVLWSILKACHRSQAAWVGSILWSFSPLIFIHDRIALQETLLTFFLLLGMWGLIHSSEQKQKIQNYGFWVFALICFAGAILTKIASVILIPFLCLSLCFAVKKVRYSSIILLCLLLGSFTTVLWAQGYGAALYALKHRTLLSRIFAQDTLSQATLDEVLNITALKLVWITEYLGVLFWTSLLLGGIVIPSARRILLLMALQLLIFFFFFYQSFYARYYCGAVILAAFLWSEFVFRVQDKGPLQRVLSYSLLAALFLSFLWIDSSVLQNPSQNSLTSTGPSVSTDYDYYVKNQYTAVHRDEITSQLEKYRLRCNRISLFLSEGFHPIENALLLRYREDPFVEIFRIPITREYQGAALANALKMASTPESCRLILFHGMSNHPYGYKLGYLSPSTGMKTRPLVRFQDLTLPLSLEEYEGFDANVMRKQWDWNQSLLTDISFGPKSRVALNTPDQKISFWVLDQLQESSSRISFALCGERIFEGPIKDLHGRIDLDLSSTSCRELQIESEDWGLLHKRLKPDLYRNFAEPVVMKYVR